MEKGYNPKSCLSCKYMKNDGAYDPTLFPQNQYFCRMDDEKYGKYIGYRTTILFELEDGKPEWCPLKNNMEKSDNKNKTPLKIKIVRALLMFFEKIVFYPITFIGLLIFFHVPYWFRKEEDIEW